MSTNKTQNKTADTWTTKVEEILIKAGLTPKWGNKTGSCIMPAPKRSQSVNPQENTEGETKTGED